MDTNTFIAVVENASHMEPDDLDRFVRVMVTVSPELVGPFILHVESQLHKADN